MLYGLLFTTSNCFTSELLDSSFKYISNCDIFMSFLFFLRPFFLSISPVQFTFRNGPFKGRYSVADVLFPFLPCGSRRATLNVSPFLD